MTVATGVRARLAYGVESSFGAGGIADSAFGVGQRLTGITGRNSIERIYEIGNVDAQKLVAQRFEGTWGVEAIMGNTSWMSDMLNHKSFVIEVGFEGATNVLRTLTGAVITRASISTRVNESVRVRIDGLYAKETVSTATSITSIADTTTPYTFAGASLTFGGQDVALVQALDIDITTGTELVYALGNRVAQDLIQRRREIGGRFNAVAQSDDFVKYMLGVGDNTATEPKQLGNVSEVSLVATFNNGTTTKTMTIDGVAINDLGSAIEAGEMILFDVAFVGRTITIS